MTDRKRYDAIVIGSGFAGAVTACRLTQAGLSVCLLERGKKYIAEQDFPVHPTPSGPHVPPDEAATGRDAIPPDTTRMFWKLGNGVWDFRDLGDVLLGQAAGYGGGSLIYANVHFRPPRHVFDERWKLPGISDGDQPYFQRGKLEDYFDLVAMELNVKALGKDYADIPKRVQLKRAAEDLGLHQGAEYLRPVSTPLAVDMKLCDLRGNCCLGCPTGAKNTLDINYLKDAEDAAAQFDVLTLAEVVSIERAKGRPRYVVTYRDLREGGRKGAVVSDHVFLCAGAVNTTELLMRCAELGMLEPTGGGLGSRFHPNQDALSAVFDCDEPQEMDRGPVITDTLLYDREPEEDDVATPRWRLAFRGAKFAPSFNQVITSDAGGTAVVASPGYVMAGSYEEEDGAWGELMLSNVAGKLQEGQKLLIDGKPWATVDIGACKSRHWFLIQDGAFPVHMEPSFGVYRSPLWLGRNGFREEQRPPGELSWPKNGEKGPPTHRGRVEHASAGQRIGYATLPIEALANLIGGATQHSLGFLAPATTQVGAQLLHWARDPEGGPARRWHLLPEQLGQALGTFRERGLDAAGLATEGIVSSFLEDAANRISEDLEPTLATVAGVDGLGEQIRDLELASRALRLGVQLLWGSQSGMARAIAEKLLDEGSSGPGQLVESGINLLRRLLDYRLGNGRTAMLLSMGLDSAPGRLWLDLPTAPALGTALRGGKSGARAHLVGTELSANTSFARGNAAGLLLVTRVSGAFEHEEELFAGKARLGIFVKEEPRPSSSGQSSQQARSLRFAPVPIPPRAPERGTELRGAVSGARAYIVEAELDTNTSFTRADAAGHFLVAGVSGDFQPKEELFAGKDRLGILVQEKRQPETGGQAHLQLRRLQFAPAKGQRPLPSAKPLAPALAAPLRAALPEAVDTPERSVQERVLRDIASAWDGELRLDPLWTATNKRITVHPQGGCPLGPKERGVTDSSGEVYGCPGLYVMDAAAFPGPVGANPSATIAAVAEYKVARFIEAFAAQHPDIDENTRRALRNLEVERLRNANRWVDEEGREALDPFDRAAAGAQAGKRPPTSVEPAHRPIGIEFDETMEGTVKSGSGEWPLKTTLTVRIEDLAEFVALNARDSTLPARITKGTITLGQGTGAPAPHLCVRDIDPDPAKSGMTIMARPQLNAEGFETRTIRYELATRDGAWSLEGRKTIRDDPGLDAWTDTTTLEVTEFRHGAVKTIGELTMPPSAFFEEQLRSFRSDTDDPAQQAWALATFGKFFFGNLAAVYLPGVERLTKLGANLTRIGSG